MDNEQDLKDLKQIRAKIEEAEALQEEVLKLLSSIFDDLIKFQPEGESSSRLNQAERYRGTAIRELSALISNDALPSTYKKIKGIASHLYNMNTLISSLTFKSSEPPVFKATTLIELKDG